MLPTFKECVEELFLRGLCRVVFATETLALGINMPARSVVIEKLSKWNGETHADITPGEYTQLTGRAGRRGIDVEGHGVVLWQQGLNPRRWPVSPRPVPIRSSRRSGRRTTWRSTWCTSSAARRARELLESSFAQFQADKAVVGLARQLRKSEDALEGYAEAAACDLGDFMEYAGLRHRLSDIEKGAAQGTPGRPPPGGDRLAGVARPGDVIEVPGGKFAGLGRRHRPRRTAADGPASLRAHRRPARPPAGLVDFPTPVVVAHPAEDPARTSTAATRSRAATSPRRCATAPTT